MDSRKKSILGENLPLIKNNNNQLTDYVIINKKYEKYIAYKNDILIGTAGSCGRVIKLEFEKGYHAHHMIKFNNLKINKDYLYYIIKPLFDSDYIKLNTNGSVLGHLRMENIKNTKIHVLKPDFMKTLYDDFNEIEQLKEQFEKTKKTYSNELDKMFKDFESKKNNLETNMINNSETNIIETTAIKSKKKPSKKVKTSEV
jgi:hypothetical protein